MKESEKGGQDSGFVRERMGRQERCLRDFRLLAASKEFTIPLENHTCCGHREIISETLGRRGRW